MITYRLRHDGPRMAFLRPLASVAMGLAIVGMHYTGMQAAGFPDDSVCLASNGGLSAGWLAIAVTAVTLSVLGIALIVAVLDNRLEARTSALASSLAEANEELVQLALHDTLTKLPNRILLEDRMEQAIESASRRKGYFAVLFFDLDGFKAVNDAYGHHTGDALLIDLAQRIRQTLRTQDTVARLGGDEFIVLSEVGEPTDAASVADRLINAIARPVTVYGHEVLVTSSVGIAIYPNDGEDTHALLTNADAAMYHAKRLGGTGYSFFEPSMNADAHEQIELLHDLRLAQERGQFVLHYQPKYEAPAGPIIGAEALLRWNHPTRGRSARTCSFPRRKNRPDPVDRRLGHQRSLPPDARMDRRGPEPLDYRREHLGAAVRACQPSRDGARRARPAQRAAVLPDAGSDRIDGHA